MGPGLIAEGVTIAQAAIAALHADAPGFEDTDWVQLVEWYDELVPHTDTRSSESIVPPRSAKRSPRICTRKTAM